MDDWCFYEHKTGDSCTLASHIGCKKLASHQSSQTIIHIIYGHFQTGQGLQTNYPVLPCRHLDCSSGTLSHPHGIPQLASGSLPTHGAYASFAD